MWCGNVEARSLRQESSDAAALYAPSSVVAEYFSRHPVMRVLALIVLWPFAWFVDTWLAMSPRAQRVAVWAIAGGIISVSMLLAAKPAHALGELDSINNNFINDFSAWMPISLGIAKALSGGIMVALFGAKYARTLAQAGGNLKATIPAIPALLLECGLPFFIVAVLAPPILNGIVSIADELGFTFGLIVPQGPDELLKQGVDLGWGTGTNVVQGYVQALIHNAQAQPPCTGNIFEQGFCNVSHWAAVGAQMSAAAHQMDLIMMAALGVGLIITLIFAMLAVEYLVATISLCITLPFAAWTLGFTGSPAQGIAGNVWGAAVGAIARYLTVFLLVTIATSTAGFIAGHLGQQSAPQPPSNLAGGVADMLGFNFSWFTPMVSAAVSLFVLYKITSKAGDIAEGVASGRGVLGGAGVGFVAGAASGVAAAASGAAIGAATGGAGAAAMGAMTGPRGAVQSGLFAMMRGGGK